MDNCNRPGIGMRWARGCLAVLLFLLGVLPARGAGISVEELVDPWRVRLTLPGGAVLELWDPVEGEVERVTDLLARALSRGGRPRVTVEGDQACLWLGDQRLASIPPEQASRWGTTPYRLARQWAAALERELPRPADVPRPPQLLPSRLVVPLGEARSARWTGGGSPRAEVEDPQVASARVSGSSVEVRGLAAGATAVVLQWPGRSLRLPVQVRPWAARWPARLSLQLTGPDSPVLTAQAVRAALSPYVHPQASLEVSQPQAGKVQVQAQGTGLLAASATLPVEVHRENLPMDPAAALAVSNRPEVVPEAGLLFARLLPAGPVRLLYHHRGHPRGESRPMELALDNRGDGPVRVRVALAAVGPSTDEIYAGHLAAWRLVDLQQRGQSYIVQVPPGRELVLDRRLLKAGQTVSGMGWLEVLEGGPVQLVVRALETDGRTSQRELPAPDTGGALGTGEGLFEPYRQEDYFHQAGSAYTFIPLGGEPYGRDPQTGEINPGNFGLVYRLRIRIDNPAGETRLAWLDFVPRAGPARAILFLDGRLVETPMQEHAASLRLATWTLEPGQSVETSVETFPQAGSNYPAFLVVGSGRP